MTPGTSCRAFDGVIDRDVVFEGIGAGDVVVVCILAAPDDAAGLIFFPGDRLELDFDETVFDAGVFLETDRIGRRAGLFQHLLAGKRPREARQAERARLYSARMATLLPARSPVRRERVPRGPALLENGAHLSYRRAGVREYLVWRTEDDALDWWALEDDEYRPLAAGDNGVVRSRVFPGLWLNAEALLAGDASRLMATLHEGLASAEHAAFVAALQQRGGN